MLSRTCTTWTFSPYMTTSFRPLPRGPFRLYGPFKRCMYNRIWIKVDDCCFRSELESSVHSISRIKVFCVCFWKAFGPEPLYLWLPSQVAGGLSPHQPDRDQWCPLHQPPASGKQKNRTDQKQEISLFRYRRLSIKIKWGLLCRFGLPRKVPLWRDHSWLLQSKTHQNPRPCSPVHCRTVSSSPSKIQVGREETNTSKHWNFSLALLFSIIAVILINTQWHNSSL